MFSKSLIDRQGGGHLRAKKKSTAASTRSWMGQNRLKAAARAKREYEAREQALAELVHGKVQTPRVGDGAKAGGSSSGPRSRVLVTGGS